MSGWNGSQLDISVDGERAIRKQESIARPLVHLSVCAELIAAGKHSLQLNRYDWVVVNAAWGSTASADHHTNMMVGVKPSERLGSFDLRIYGDRYYRFLPRLSRSVSSRWEFLEVLVGAQPLRSVNIHRSVDEYQSVLLISGTCRACDKV